MPTFARAKSRMATRIKQRAEDAFSRLSKTVRHGHSGALCPGSLRVHRCAALQEVARHSIPLYAVLGSVNPRSNRSHERGGPVVPKRRALLALVVRRKLRLFALSQPLASSGGPHAPWHLAHAEICGSQIYLAVPILVGLQPILKKTPQNGRHLVVQ
jgi:hypothetical protein